MHRSPEWFADELASGDADRINDAIDHIEDCDATERVDDYDALFEACRPVYDHDDGYVRQSVVRFLRDAYPQLEIRLAGTDADRVDGVGFDDLSEPRERLVDFLLTALTDDDGRVRRATVDGFRTLGMALALAGLTTAQQALVNELDALFDDVSNEEVRKHVEEARQAVDRGVGVAGLLSGIDIDAE